MSTSDNTRVYRLDGSITDTVLVSDALNARRVRLVGDSVVGGLPAPARLPIAGLLPGVLVKRASTVVPSGGAVLAPSGSVRLPVNDVVVSSVTLRNTTFATTESGSLWQQSDDTWQTIPLAGLSVIALNREERAPVRKLAAVGDRLLIIVAANVKTHDGVAQPLLINRRLVQTPIDALDVVSGVWYADLLQHAVEKNISDIDIVQWNGTMFGVVDHATSETTMFEWRAFAREPQKCDAVSDCNACFTDEANIEACRWCGTRCAPALASCMPGEETVGSVAMCRPPSAASFASNTLMLSTVTSASDVATRVTRRWRCRLRFVRLCPRPQCRCPTTQSRLDSLSVFLLL